MFGLADATVAGLAFTAVAINIADRVSQGTWDPTRYFHYFTIQTTIINVVVLALGAFFSLNRPRDPNWYSAARACVVAYGVVVGVVYNLLLSDFPADGGYINNFPWTNELEHVWIPIYLVVEWVVVAGRARLGWRVLAVCAVYPLVWASASMARGLVGDGWFPYFFLNPSETGISGVALYIAAIAAFMVALCAFAVSTQRVHARIAENLSK